MWLNKNELQVLIVMTLEAKGMLSFNSHGEINLHVYFL